MSSASSAATVSGVAREERPITPLWLYAAGGGLVHDLLDHVERMLGALAETDKGGHFAAWEQPQLFCEEVRAGLRSLR